MEIILRNWGLENNFGGQTIVVLTEYTDSVNN